MSSVLLNNNLTTGIVAVNTSMLASGQKNQVIGVVNDKAAINKRIHKELVDNGDDVQGVVFPLISAVQSIMQSDWCSKAPTHLNRKPLLFDDLSKILFGFRQYAVMGVPVIIHVQDEFLVLGNLNE